MTDEQRVNWVSLGNGFTLVRTQAGFRKVLKMYCEENNLDIDDVENYPTKYPAVITIHTGYRGYHYPQVKEISTNALVTLLGKYYP